MCARARVSCHSNPTFAGGAGSLPFLRAVAASDPRVLTRGDRLRTSRGRTSHQSVEVCERVCVCSPDRPDSHSGRGGFATTSRLTLPAGMRRRFRARGAKSRWKTQLWCRMRCAGPSSWDLLHS